MVLKAGVSSNLVHLSEEEKSTFEKHQNELHEAELERWFDLIKSAIGELSRSEFPRYVVEVCMLRITRPEPRMSFKELVDRLEALEARLSGGTVVASGGGGAGINRSTEAPSTTAKSIPAPKLMKAASKSDKPRLGSFGSGVEAKKALYGSGHHAVCKSLYG